MKNKIIASLIIGRKGSTLKDKNIIPIFGEPLFLYTAAAALRSKKINHFYISSDCPKILSIGKKAGYSSILRPKNLSGCESQSSDVVFHAIEMINNHIKKNVDIVVVQHANVGTIDTSIIDKCIDEILKDKSISAVIPCHEKNEYHPFRCKKLKDGILLPFVDLEENVSGNRQDLPPAYFFDHSIWVLNTKKIESGQSPWKCMGNKIKPFFSNMECFDVHNLEDIKKTKQWIKKNKIPIPTKRYLQNLIK
jgi:CMP-N-acetylneuraminic acid synthetase